MGYWNEDPSSFLTVSQKLLSVPCCIDACFIKSWKPKKQYREFASKTEGTVFWILILEMTSYYLCGNLLGRTMSPMGEEITQGHEYQKVGITGGGASYKSVYHSWWPFPGQCLEEFQWNTRGRNQIPMVGKRMSSGVLWDTCLKKPDWERREKVRRLEQGKAF